MNTKMISFRWLILRLFWSLLLLPFVAFAVLWFLHEVAFSDVYLQDEFVVLLLWVLLFAATSVFLNHLGAERFAYLEAAGHEALAQNQEERAEKIFALMQALFASGLLSKRLQQSLQPRFLRQYFSFYAGHPGHAYYREQLLKALRTGIRAEESYNILKTHVMQQPALTMPVADLAEELLEREPEDHELLAFMTRQYLQEGQTHYRAEPIYARYLAYGGPLTPKIVSLCLRRLVHLQRRDDFAAWCYVRALQQGIPDEPSLRKLLYEIHYLHQHTGRREALANVITTVVSDFTPEEITGWRTEQQTKQARSLGFRSARARFRLQQALLGFYSRLRERRKWTYAFASTAVVLGMGYWALSRSPASKPAEATPAMKDSTAVYFSLQVGAVRNVKVAEREAEKWRRRGLEAHVLKAQTSKGWQRLRVGKYRSKQAAQHAADSLRTVGMIRDYFIVNYEKR
jgi:hypothetical protein